MPPDCGLSVLASMTYCLLHLKVDIKDPGVDTAQLIGVSIFLTWKILEDTVQKVASFSFVVYLCFVVNLVHLKSCMHVHCLGTQCNQRWACTIDYKS